MKNFDYINIHSVNPLYLIIDKVDGYIEENNENKYLILAFTEKKKKRSINKIHKTLGWDLIEKINDKPGEYGKDFMKIKFNSDDNLSLNKILRLHNLTIVARSVFQEDNNYYPQVFLDEYLYEL